MSTSPGLLGAQRHPISLERPARNFFDGALLGNGGIGVVVVTRPDAVVLHVGHNDIWDERIYENSPEVLGTFDELWARIQAADAAPGGVAADESLNELLRQLNKPYAYPFPRPFPCGTLVLGLPRRHVEVLGHTLHLDEGRCEVNMLHEGRPATLEVFVDQDEDRVFIRWLAENGQPSPSPIDRVRLIPDAEGLAVIGDNRPAATLADGVIDTTEDNRMPDPRALVDSLDESVHGMSFVRLLPSRMDGTEAPEDRYVLLAVQTTDRLSKGDRASWSGGRELFYPLETQLEGCSAEEPFRAVLWLGEARRESGGLEPAQLQSPGPDAATYDEAWLRSKAGWSGFWSRSAVELAHCGLEQMWYRNSYFTRCAIRPGHWSPGLFGPWSYRDIGTAWHGDYHMNYNTQQAYWGVLSANRPELHEPYFDLVDHLVEIGRTVARDFYQLPGSCIPHCAYPVPMTTTPAANPPWGWEIFETPWTVLQLWQHYEYYPNVPLLRDRIIPPMREAIRFLIAFVNRPDVLEREWGDDSVHFWPIIVPEVYGLTPGFKHNADGLAEIVFTRAALQAYLKASGVLAKHGLLSDEDARLEAPVRSFLARLPELPTVDSPDGLVLASVAGEDPDVVYNVPVAVFSVFPGLLHGLQSDADTRDLLVRTWRRQRLEGGNELVLAALQGARLGVLDIEAWYRQVVYCTLQNGTSTNLALEAGGRYVDSTPFDFMLPTGIWVENFSLTAVVDTCLLQDDGGVVHLFPSWPAHLDASFTGLRVRGGIQASAQLRGGQVDWIELVADAATTTRVVLPDAAGAWALPPGGSVDNDGRHDVMAVELQMGTIVRIERAS